MNTPIAGLPPGATLQPISPAPQQAIAGLPPGATVKPIGAGASPSGGQPSANGGQAPAAPPNPNQWATNIVPGNQLWNPAAASQQAAQDWTSWSASQRQKDLQSGKPSFGINLPFGMRLDKAALEGAVGGAEQAAANFWTPKNAALTVGAMLPVTNVPVLLYLVGQGTQLATAPREINEDHSDYVGRVVNGLAMVVGAGAGLAKVAPETAALPGKIKAYQAARAQASATAIKGINRVVDAGGTEARSVILHATEKAYESQVSEKFQAINAKDEADIAAKGNIPQINIQPASDAIDAAKEVYGQTSESNPASAKKLATLNNTSSQLTFEQAKQLRSSLYDARLEAANPNQSAILTAGYNALGKLLQERANNLGMQNEYLDATENTGVIKGSEPGKSLGRIIQKLQGAETGSDFWNIINTQADGPDLERLQTSLEQAGTLPKGFLDNIQDHYAKAQALLKSVGKGGNFMGILRSVMQYPARSIPTYMAGHAAGGFVGGYIALGWMNDLAQRLDIESELNRLGSKPAESLFKNRGATPPIEGGATPPIKGGATIGERLANKGQTLSKVSDTTSARHAELQASANRLGPEFAEGERQHLITHYKEVLNNPDATSEEKSIASSQLADLTESGQNPAPSGGRGAGLEQGGHAGGGVASVEELARPGRFVKISRGGTPSDMGKSPDFGELKPGEAGYQVKPDGTYELRAGQESPATKLGVENYAKEVYGQRRAAPSDLLYHATDVSRVPKIQAEGLRPGTWFANSPEEAMRSGATPISGNRAGLRVFSVPRAEITPGTPDSADMGAGNPKFTYSANAHPSPTLLSSENAGESEQALTPSAGRGAGQVIPGKKSGIVNIDGTEYEVQADGTLRPLEDVERQRRVKETVQVSKRIEQGERELERLEKMKSRIGPARYEEAVKEISKMLNKLKAQVEH